MPHCKRKTSSSWAIWVGGEGKARRRFLSQPSHPHKDTQVHANFEDLATDVCFQNFKSAQEEEPSANSFRVLNVVSPPFARSYQRFESKRKSPNASGRFGLAKARAQACQQIGKAQQPVPKVFPRQPAPKQQAPKAGPRGVPGPKRTMERPIQRPEPPKDHISLRPDLQFPNRILLTPRWSGRWILIPEAPLP